MQEIKTVNYIHIGGETYLWEDLPEEKRKKVAEAMQVNAMAAAGFRRNSA